MRIVLMATGDIAVPTFRALEASGQLVALFTQPDRPVGRHLVLTPPYIKTLALEASVAVYQPERMRDADAVAALAALDVDVLVVMAYGQILSQEVIDCPRLACINAHASLLPRHRGAACIQAAIEAGDDESGMTIMHVVKKLDAGDIISQCAINLEGTETAESLHDALSDITPALLMQSISALEDGSALRMEQDESLMTYAPKLLRPHGELDWAQPAFQVARKIRAYHSWPGTFTSYPSVKKDTDKLLKIFPPINVFARIEKPVGTVDGEVLEAGPEGLLVSCGGVQGGAILIATMQPPGSRKMNAESFFAGHKIMPGTILGKRSE